MTTQISLQLPGWINTFYRHHKGKKLGPYYVRRWKVGSKVHREYIKPADLPKVRVACDAHRAKKKRQSAFASNYSLVEGNLNYLQRMCKRMKKAPLRKEDYEFALEIDKRGYAIPGRPKLRSTRAFMVPFFANCTNQPSMHAMQSEILALARKKMNTVLRKMETDEEKIARWKKERESIPKPLLWRRDLGEVSRQEIVDAIDNFLKNRIENAGSLE